MLTMVPLFTVMTRAECVLDSGSFGKSVVGSVIRLSRDNARGDLEHFAHREYTVVGRARQRKWRPPPPPRPGPRKRSPRSPGRSPVWTPGAGHRTITHNQALTAMADRVITVKSGTIPMLSQITRHGLHHGPGGHLQPREKTHPQRHDAENRQKTPEARFDFPERPRSAGTPWTRAKCWTRWG